MFYLDSRFAVNKSKMFCLQEKGISGGIVIIKGSDLTLEGNIFGECSKDEAKRLVQADKDKKEKEREEKENKDKEETKKEE